VDEAVRRIRSFNRLVTERVGALDDRYLAGRRPLGEARVLWEIGETGAEVRRLRERLGLDSGYLSRLLRSLEADGVVRLSTAAADARVRTAELTRAGRTERRRMDGRSDDLARSLLDPLNESQRRRLVDAMSEVEALLTAGLVEIDEVDPSYTDARSCLAEYFAELGTRFDTGFDPTLSTAPTVDEFRRPAGLFLVARLRSEPVGCAALKLPLERPSEIKRMWVARSARGLGVGRRLLGVLERCAADAGARTIRLETNQTLTEAISLYRSAGYRDVDPFNDELYAHHWFEKDLAR
jgi:DNA-binding MarR family transcriptional regulator/GNAT superfamily N-acetyltransferase